MIRKITINDKDQFLSMTRDFYSTDAVIAPIPESYHTGVFEELMNGNLFLDAVILEKNGETAGYSLLNFSWSQEAGGKVVWVEELYVKPEFQGQGLGKVFFAYLQANYPAARYRLEVEPENERAVGLYKKTGFEVLPYGQMILDMMK